MKINSWHVKNQQDVDKILNNLPKGKSEKRPDFVIKGISLYKYLSGLLEGDPEQCLWSEFIIPFHGLDTSNLSRLGIHYIIPTAKKAPLESYDNRVYSKLPNWRYHVNLVSKDYERSLTFIFWIDALLSEEELKDFIAKNADWSLSEEYLI